MPGAHSLASTGLLQRHNGVNNVAAPQRQTIYSSKPSFYLSDRGKENIRVLHLLSRPGFLVMQSEQSLHRNDPLSNVPSQVNGERGSSYTSSASSKSSTGRPDQLTEDFQDSLTHLPFNHFDNDDIEDATAEDESPTAADNVTNQQVLQQPTQETIRGSDSSSGVVRVPP
jgi:hypothetical protein